MIGRGWPIPVGLLLSLNEHLLRGRVLALLAVASIATSVALATGLQMTAQSVESQLEKTADAIAGAAKIEVTGGNLGIPESLLETVQQVPGVSLASPYVEATLVIPDGNIPIHVLGVDFTAEQQVRSYEVKQEGLQVRDPLRLLARPKESVLVSEAFSQRHQRGEGERFRARFPGGTVELEIEGMLSGPLAQAFGGQIAVMDVYGLQALLGRQGWIDRIDVVPGEGVDVDTLIAQIQPAVSGVATARRSSQRDSYIEQGIATVQLAALFFSCAGVLIACILSYAAIGLSVSRRIPQLVLLRSIGLDARRVRRFIYMESALFASIGTVFGLALGFALSRIFIRLFSELTESEYGIEVFDISMTPWTLTVAALVGVAVALAGSIGPARRAASRYLLDATSPSEGRSASAELGRHSVTLFVVFLAAAIVALFPTTLPPMPRALVLLGAGLGAVAAGAGLLLAPLYGLRGVFERIFPRVGHLVGSSFRARPRAFSLTVAAMAGTITVTSSILIVVHSFSESFAHWADARFPDAVFVTAGDPLSGPYVSRELISPDTLAIVRSTPGVSAVNDQYASESMTIIFHGREVALSASSMGVIAEHHALTTVARPPDQVARDLVQGDIAVSENFAKNFEVSTGDSISIDTPRGQRSFRVAGIVRTFATNVGALYLDTSVFDSLWHRDGSTSLTLWTEGERDTVLKRIRGRVGDRQPLFFAYGAQLRSLALSAADRLRGLLRLISALALLLSGLATSTLLASSVVERSRELALLRVAGALPRDLVSLVVADGLLLAVLASSLGLVLGLACSFPLADVLRAAYSWSLGYAVDARELALLLAGAVLLMVIAAGYPALKARSTLTTDVFSPE